MAHLYIYLNQKGMNGKEKAYCVFGVLQLLAPNTPDFTSKQTTKITLRHRSCWSFEGEVITPLALV